MTQTLPDMRAVESSNIHSVGYDPSEHDLFIRFKSGGTYRYADVPAHIHSDFLSADSKGKFFRERFAGKFSHTKVT